MAMEDDRILDDRLLRGSFELKRERGDRSKEICLQRFGIFCASRFSFSIRQRIKINWD